MSPTEHTDAPEVPTRRIHDHLIEERHGPVVIVRVDREDRLGALSRDMVEALGPYLSQLAGEADVQVMILTGTGRGFIAGADIGEYHGVTQQSFDTYQRLSRRVFGAVAELPQITIAAVNGYALGGGFELALCCDLIVAAQSARFGLPEIDLGLLPGGGGTQRLARAVGERLTKELVLTGRRMYPDEAAARGLLVDVVPDAELTERAISLADTIASKAPLAAREAKRVICDGLDAALSTGLTLEQRVLSALFATGDADEGVTAFVEKRPPQFTGR